MCTTIWQCCCFAVSLVFVVLYILLLLLDLHIESIIDSYHERNIYDHCLTLFQQNINEDSLFNEIHEVINRDNYHYHYYEKNSNPFDLNLLQNSICIKYYFKIKQQTDLIDLMDDEESNTSFTDNQKINNMDNNKEIVHETYVCNDNDANGECNHCIYYESTINSLQWTKCEIISNNTNHTNYGKATPKQMRKQSEESVKNIKSEWNIYSDNLSDFADKMKKWQSQLPQTIMNIPSFDIDNPKTFIYIENESCVEGTDCKYKKHCINYQEKEGKYENCSIQANDAPYLVKYQASEKYNYVWKLIVIIIVSVIIYAMIHYESTVSSEKCIWKSRAMHLSSKYTQQQLCAICYEPFEPRKEAIILRCGHRFHVKCLNEWEWEQNQRYSRELVFMIQLLYVYCCKNWKRHKCPNCSRTYCVGNQKFAYQHAKYKDY